MKKIMFVTLIIVTIGMLFIFSGCDTPSVDDGNVDRTIVEELKAQVQELTNSLGVVQYERDSLLNDNVLVSANLVQLQESYTTLNKSFAQLKASSNACEKLVRAKYMISREVVVDMIATEQQLIESDTKEYTTCAAQFGLLNCIDSKVRLEQSKGRLTIWELIRDLKKLKDSN